MRFAGNTSNVSSWIQAGRAGAKGAADAFKVARASAPDYGGIAEANMKSRSAERVAATEAEAYVAQAGIEAKKDVKLTNIKTDAESKILDKRIDAKRMAGMVGMFGTVALGGVQAVSNNQAAAKQKQRDAEEDARENLRTQYLASQINNTPDAPELKPWQAGEPPKPSTYQTKPFDPESVDYDGDSPSDSSSDTSGIKPGKTLTQQQMTDLAVKAGFTPEQATIMGAIGMGESNGNPTIDTSQTIDPGKKNEYSIGIFQINTQAHGDKLAKLGYSEDDLRDPFKNVKVAKMVFDEVGGSFKPWGAYTNGSYSKFLPK